MLRYVCRCFRDVNGGTEQREILCLTDYSNVKEKQDETQSNPGCYRETGIQLFLKISIY